MTNQAGRQTKAISRIGIVMPCYNLGEYIDDAIKSLQKQTLQDFTVVLTDDGSTDKKTIAKLQSLQLPSNYTVHLETANSGMNKIVNKYAHKLSCEYLLVFSADDMLKPTYLEETSRFLDTYSDYAAVSTWLQYTGAAKGIRKYNPTKTSLPAMLLQNNFCGSALIRKTVWDQLGGYATDPSQKVHQDYELWLRVLESGEKLGIIEEPLFLYRIRDVSASHMLNSKTEEAWVRYVMRQHAALYRQYGNEIIADLWIKNIQNSINYAETLKGHEWLDSEYKKLTKQVESLAAQNSEMSLKLQKIEANPVFRIALKMRRLLKHRS